MSDSQALLKAVDHIDTLLIRRLKEGLGPGLALAVTTDQALVDSRVYGVVNADSQAPVTRNTLFQTGSITKQLVGAACMRLMDQGKFDVQASIQHYLPWFDLPSPYDTPITIHHLLTHTSGMIMMLDSIPSSWAQAWMLRDTELGFEPGTNFAYSNVAYNVLQCVIETIMGQGFDACLRELIFDPLGMRDTYGEIRHERFHRMALGHKDSAHDDRPVPRPEKPMVVNWHELSEGCGSVVTTAADLATFLRMLLRSGIADDDSRFLQEETFGLMMTSHAEMKGFFEGTTIGYGTFIEQSAATGGQRRILGGGENLGTEATLYGDPKSGLGVVLFCNSYQPPWREIRWALDVLLAAHEECDLPDWPHEQPNPTHIGEQASEFEGEYTSESTHFSIRAEDERLVFYSGSESVDLERIGGDRFLVRHPNFSHAMLVFGRNEDNAVVEAFQHGTWYRSERYEGECSFNYPTTWDSYAGQYRAFGYFVDSLRFFVRKDHLLCSSFGGYAESPLTPLGDGLFRIGDETSPHRFTFDWLAGDKMLRCAGSDGPFYRVTT